jgi:hypothetical protein
MIDSIQGERYIGFWSRSLRGNLTRVLRGRRLTVFERPEGSGCWSFCIAGPGKRGRVEWSRCSWMDEWECAEAAEQALTAMKGVAA